MVGVPGRSKGCNTCRRRRVKCDEGKPTCQRCAKAGFECLGYNRGIIWRHASTAPFVDAKDQTPRAPHAESVPVTLLRTTPLPTGGPQHYLNLPSSKQRFRSPPQEMSLVAFQDDFAFSHMFANFIFRAYGNVWLMRAAEGKIGDLALDVTKAIAQANFGRVIKQAKMEASAEATYGRCLGTLAAQLGAPSELEKDRKQDLIVPVLIVMMHASISADRQATILHLQGLARLLHICGAEAFQKQPLLNAFESARTILTIGCLMTRQRLFLEVPRWRTSPWGLDPEAKSAQSRLLDILVTVPGMLEDLNRLDNILDMRTTPHSSSISPTPSTSTPGSSHSSFDLFIDPDLLHLSLVTRVCRGLEAIYRWRWTWQSASGHEVSVDETDTTHQANHPATRSLGSIGIRRRRDRLRFARFGAATEIMLYNAVLMWLLVLLWKLEPLRASSLIETSARRAATAAQKAAQIVSRLSSFEPLRRPGGTVGVRDAATEICRVFDWQTKHAEGSSEPAYMYLFPVGMAMSVLRMGGEDDEAELKWVEEMLRRSPVTSGFAGGGGGGVAGFESYVTVEAMSSVRSMDEEPLANVVVSVGGT